MMSPQNTASSLPRPTAKATWPGVCSRRRQNAQMIADRKIVAHDVRPPGFDHRQDAVAERRHLGLGVLLGPVVIFGLAEDVARLGKGRNPAAAFRPRIPA